jgi:hypothetical protein
MRRYMILVALLALAGACEGPMGPSGPEGPRGEMGERGSPGETGEPGRDGADGQPGRDGADGHRAVRSTYCTALIEIGLALEYDIVEYSDGGVWLSCSVSDPGATYSSSRYYDARQNGARTKGCEVTYDIDTPNFGWWRFTAEDDSPRVEYRDTQSPDDGREYVYSMDNCQIVNIN